MSAPGSSNALGVSEFKNYDKFAFKVPCTQPPPEDGSRPVPAGSKTDMGALVLCLVANWFVNGETVLIDGGVSAFPDSSFAALGSHALDIDVAAASFVLLNDGKTRESAERKAIEFETVRPVLQGRNVICNTVYHGRRLYLVLRHMLRERRQDRKKMHRISLEM